MADRTFQLADFLAEKAADAIGREERQAVCGEANAIASGNERQQARFGLCMASSIAFRLQGPATVPPDFLFPNLPKKEER
jgi:hypothetical protein